MQAITERGAIHRSSLESEHPVFPHMHTERRAECNSVSPYTTDRTPNASLRRFLPQRTPLHLRSHLTFVEGKHVVQVISPRIRDWFHTALQQRFHISEYFWDCEKRSGICIETSTQAMGYRHGRGWCALRCPGEHLGSRCCVRCE
eukprot:GHVU01135676.1.p1 GENE.GHVU01135676.1~~GHVU01135676.1.p1  ORF type:complete len:145 (-),score=0.98 GHVU01135676.1:571-1005(-)